MFFSDSSSYYYNIYGPLKSLFKEERHLSLPSKLKNFDFGDVIKKGQWIEIKECV